MEQDKKDWELYPEKYQTEEDGVTFKLKKDGTPRKMTCRLVSNDKFFKGGELLGDRSHLLEVIDIDLLRRNKGKDPTRCWRSIQLNNITSLKAMGVEWVK